jgi:hypothetical protein
VSAKNGPDLNRAQVITRGQGRAHDAGDFGVAAEHATRFFERRLSVGDIPCRFAARSTCYSTTAVLVDTFGSPVPLRVPAGPERGARESFVSRSDQDGTSAAELFDLLWESLADVLGTAATAILVRRAMKQAASLTSWPEPVIVARDGLDYKYRLPEPWKQPGNEEALGALRVVAAELRVLLVELTGPVVLRRLGRLAPFRERGIDFSDEAPND